MIWVVVVVIGAEVVGPVGFVVLRVVVVGAGVYCWRYDGTGIPNCMSKRTICWSCSGVGLVGKPRSLAAFSSIVTVETVVCVTGPEYVGESTSE